MSTSKVLLDEHLHLLSIIREQKVKTIRCMTKPKRSRDEKVKVGQKVRRSKGQIRLLACVSVESYLAVKVQPVFTTHAVPSLRAVLGVTSLLSILMTVIGSQISYSLWDGSTDDQVCCPEIYPKLKF